MPSVVIQLLALMTVVGTSLATVALGPSPVHPDHPGKCWSNTEKKSFSDGGYWQEPHCIRASCTAYKGRLYLQYASCPSIGLPTGCTTTEDLSLPYPGCCPMPYCPTVLEPAELLGEEYDDFTNWISETYDEPTMLE